MINYDFLDGDYEHLAYVGYIDRVIPKTKPCHVCHGQAVAAMLLNSLGFPSQALYLVLEYFSDKLIDLLISLGLYRDLFCTSI